MSKWADDMNAAIEAAGLDPSRPFGEDPGNFMSAMDVIEERLSSECAEE